MKLALDQGYATVYATTVAAAGILERLGWEFIKTVVHSDGQLAVYRCDLEVRLADSHQRQGP